MIVFIYMNISLFLQQCDLISGYSSIAFDFGKFCGIEGLTNS